MSGGHFEYIQYRFNDIANEIEDVIAKNNIKDEYGFSSDYSKKTLKEFKKGINLLKKAQIYVQRIDYLLSEDDGEDTFHERLKDDLLKLKV